jgi:hypothetical protein
MVHTEARWPKIGLSSRHSENVVVSGFFADARYGRSSNPEVSATMLKRSFRQWCLLASLMIVAGMLSAAPSFSSQQSLRKVEVNMADSGKTVALAVGQQLVVTVPLIRYDDAYWFVSVNSGPGLKLVAGPNTKRPINWTPYTNSAQVFYFTRVAPGTVNLALEQSYWAKPMVLRVVDR